MPAPEYVRGFGFNHLKDPVALTSVISSAMVALGRVPLKRVAATG